MKNVSFFVILIILTILYSCRKIYDTAGENIVINELMPVNSTTAADNYREYDDWIELYNLSSSVKDLSGYFLSDNRNKKTKWQFPQGTSISGNGYLIIWADNDTTQLGLHTNFKLSSLGEEVVLSKPDGAIIDEIVYSAQNLELSYSRIPNGTGSFTWKTATFNKSNDSK